MEKEAIKVKELSPLNRSGNFNEVVLGYSEEEALLEALRCIQCKDPRCVGGCPVGIDIKRFIHEITSNEYASAYYTIREKNDFPSICGRVCPAEFQCRKACILNKSDLPYACEQAINIHFLERFVGDYGIKNKLEPAKDATAKILKEKVAVIGSEIGRAHV